MKWKSLYIRLVNKDHLNNDTRLELINLAKQINKTNKISLTNNLKVCDRFSLVLYNTQQKLTYIMKVRDSISLNN